MAVAFKTSQAASGIAGTSLTMNYPASKASGDLAIAIVETGNSASAPSLAGFTLVARSGVGSTGSGTGATQICVFHRLLDGSEGASASFTGGVDHCVGIMLLYTGADTTTPVTASTGSGSASAQTSVSTNSIAQKTGDQNDMFLACYAWDRDAATASARTNSNFANLTGETITNRGNTGTGSNAGGGYLIEEGDPASDSSGAVTHSVDFTSSIWAGLLVRINAAATSVDGSGSGGPGTVTSSASGGVGSGGANAAAGPGTVTSSSASGVGSGAANGAAGIAAVAASAAGGTGAAGGSGAGGLAANDATAPQGVGSATSTGSGAGAPGSATAIAPGGTGSGDGTGSGSSNVVQLVPPSGVGSVQVDLAVPVERTTIADPRATRETIADQTVRSTSASRRAA